MEENKRYKQLFSRFLKENNIYKEYIFKRRKISDRFPSTRPDLYFIISFSWYDNNDYHNDFWFKLHTKWINFFKKIIEYERH